MSCYLNPLSTRYSKLMRSKVFVDKTDMLEILNENIDTENCYFCLSRPRRFGKSYAANMLAAYYSKGADAEKMFSGLAISKSEDFKIHLNKYDVIHING